MTPEGGDLRPPLLDRFALCVDIHSINNPQERVHILEHTLAFERDAEKFSEMWRPEEESLSRIIAHARQLLPEVTYSPHDLQVIAELMSDMEVDGHRGDIVILKTAITNAAFEGRNAINTHDILIAAELALPHRLKRKPFQETEVALETLADRLEKIESDVSEQAQAQVMAGQSATTPQEKKTNLTTKNPKL